MPRQTIDLTTPEFPGTRNRDRGKLFRLTEWPAARAEHWGMRMLLVTNSGAGELPLNVAGIGLEGVAVLGLNAFLRGNVNADALIPLLDELLECVQIVRDRSKPQVATPIAVDEDIEEVATRLWLRGEVLSLHLGFSVSAALSALYSKIMMNPENSRDSSIPSTSLPE